MENGIVSGTLFESDGNDLTVSGTEKTLNEQIVEFVKERCVFTPYAWIPRDVLAKACTTIDLSETGWNTFWRVFWNEAKRNGWNISSQQRTGKPGLKGIRLRDIECVPAAPLDVSGSVTDPVRKQARNYLQECTKRLKNWLDDYAITAFWPTTIAEQERDTFVQEVLIGEFSERTVDLVAETIIRDGLNELAERISKFYRTNAKQRG
ncbi:MAG: hypothetical protein DRN81_03850 [Thermoproteota archaeon]|nr:MAG: hypothetical protein DRN81_03850 [Candidatus Korarchaeota archaeon]